MKSDSQPKGPDKTVTLPLVEEELAVGKREVVTGRIRVKTVTDAIEEFVRQDLKGERVEVERIPMDRYVDGEAPQIRTENDVLIVPVVEEVLVVEKRLLLKEELHIRRRTVTETAEVPITLRKQRAVVERIEGDDASAKQAKDS